MDERLAHAFLPPTCKIAGRRVSRFSLWSRFILDALESPLVTGEKFGPEDLINALKVCQARHGKPLSLKPTLRDFYWLGKYRRNPKRFKDDATTFVKWVNFQTSPPKYWREGNGGGKSTVLDRVPSTLGLACSLMGKGGLGMSEAWDTPLGAARWMDAQFAKMEGAGIHFLDDEDLNDTPDPFEGMSQAEVLEHFRKEHGDEDKAVRAFERWQNTTQPT
jgi:hypothetical protein